MLDTGYKAGQHALRMMRLRDRETAVKWLHRAYDGAAAHISQTDPIDDRRDFHASLATLRARVEITPWPGIRGKTDLKNLLARINICEQRGDWDHTVSERDLAERIGCSRAAVIRSNSRLVAANRLRQMDSGTSTKAARWMLILAVLPTLSHHETTPQGLKAGGALSGLVVRQPDKEPNIDSHTAARLMPKDAFAHFGLSGSGLAIVAALAERNDQTAAELVGTASVSRATAFRQLTKLVGLGLVEKTDAVYHLVPTAVEGAGQPTHECTDPVQNWNEAAERLGTAGTARRRRERHNDERKHWEKTRERLAQRRRPATLIPNPRRAPQGCVLPNGAVVDPRTGEITPWRVATDGELILPAANAEDAQGVLLGREP
ncbi:helix-turn-helix domain-containing protein [Streptomyces solisilvae]|uniref:helix-turn-helix domain-containing protein n=1 Tax=Streptomyces malaysiensis TaxID=92644 RepID=UPI0036BEE833